MDKDLLIFLGTLPWALFLFVVLFYINGRGPKEKRLKFLLGFVLIFAAIRYGIGYDYFSYKYIIEGNGQDYELERWEMLPRYLALFCGKTHYQLFFAISSFLTIYPVYYVSKKLSVDPLKSFFVYLMFPLFFLDGLGVMRNAVAYSFALLMFYNINRKKYLYSLLCLLFAVGFHISAVVAILLYPLYFLFHKKYLNIVLYLSSFVLSISIVPILESFLPYNFLLDKVMSNVDKGITTTGGLLFYVVNGIAIFHLLYWERISSISSNNKIYLTLVNVGVFLWNVFLGLDPTTAQRLSLFFLLFIVLLVPSYISISLRNKRFINSSVNVLFVSLFVSSLVLNLYAYYEKGRNMSNIPYQVFFLNPSDALLHINDQ